MLKKFLNIANHVGYAINQHLSNEPQLVNLIKFKLNDKNEDEILQIINQEKLVEKITASELNQTYLLDGIKETVLSHLLNKKYEKIADIVLNHPEIDFSFKKNNQTYLQCAIQKRVNNKLIAHLVKSTPKEYINTREELGYFITLNGLINELQPNQKIDKENFKQVLINYVEKFQDDLSELNIFVSNDVTKEEILTFCNRMGAKDALEVLLDLDVFSKKEVENAMNAHSPFNSHIPKEFFEPYLIKKEKQTLEASIALQENQSNDSNNKNSKKIKI